jgi:hypothetical protein
MDHEGGGNENHCRDYQQECKVLASVDDSRACCVALALASGNWFEFG